MNRKVVICTKKMINLQTLQFSFSIEDRHCVTAITLSAKSLKSFLWKVLFLEIFMVVNGYTTQFRSAAKCPLERFYNTANKIISQFNVSANRRANILWSRREAFTVFPFFRTIERLFLLYFTFNKADC